MAAHTPEDAPSLDSRTPRLAILGELLAEMAHEINNLMVGVLGYADLELHRHEDDPSPDVLQIVECAKEVRNLTRTILSFTRDVGPVGAGSVEEAVETVLGLFRHRARGTRLSCELRSPLPAVAMATGDLRLVLANLVKNALEAVEGASSPVVRVMGRTDGDRVVVQVWNSGDPIPEDVLPRIFDPFVTTKPDDRGTGLGLAISRRLIRQTGGEISAQNPEKGGVSFTLSLPRAAEMPADPEAEEPAPDAAPRVEGRHVLVVDDDNTAREVIRLMVSDMGGGLVETCSSGAEALRVIRSREFDAVVLDLRMAGLSGEEVYRRLPKRLKSRVVFVTGDTLGSSTRKFLSATRQPALFKPLDWRELLRAVHSVTAA